MKADWMVRSAALTALTITALPSCDNTACTEANCIPGARVSFDPPVSMPFDIEIDADGVVASYRCDQGVASGSGDVPLHSCDSSSVLVAGVFERLTIRINSLDGSVALEACVLPQYEEVWPNGMACEPVCLSANSIIPTSGPNTSELPTCDK